LQYTIEARELTSGQAHGRLSEAESRRTTIEADGPDEAISQFLVRSSTELVSVYRPARGQESIATVKHGDAVYLVRVYAT
jgi:hypothetical protein